MKKYAIIVDSISTIGSNGNPNIEDVFVLPLGLTTPDEKHLEDITSNISIDDILESAKEKKYYKTSTTKIGVFYNLIEKLVLGYENIIYLTISSELSSQFASLSRLINLDPDYKDKVWIIDTLSAGYAIEKMVIEIKKIIILKESITKDEINRIIKLENNSSEEYIICKNLSGVNKGGRIKQTLIKIIDKLAKIPIILFEKKNNLKSLVKDYYKAYHKITEWVLNRCKKDNKKITEICLVGSNSYSKEKIEQFTPLLSKLFNISENNISYRNIMYPVLVHTLFDTICFYFKFE